MLSGAAILFIFLVTTNFSFTKVDEHLYFLLSLNNNPEKASYWPLQSFSHLFLHANIIHLFSNVAGLGLASAYERRVGAKRFFTVLFVGCVASIPSIFFYSGTVTLCGISGGVFGLAAAFFTDEDKLNLKEWWTAIILFAVIAAILAIQDEFKSKDILLNLRVDYIGHALGALGAIVYCRWKPISKNN